MTDEQYTELNVEIATDPKSLGYSGKSNPDIAALLNAIGGSSETIDQGALDGQELQKAVVISEYTALSDIQRDAWVLIISAGAGQVDIADQRVRGQIAAIWGSGTTTRANLLALTSRDASRAEVLFGAGASVSHTDVGKAVLYYGE